MTVPRRINWIGTVLAILFLNAFVNCQEDPEPSLVIKPEGKVSRSAGQDFQFTCLGSDKDGAGIFTNLKWFNPDGQEIVEASGHLSIMEDGNNLYLTFIKPVAEDSGMYRCTGTYESARELVVESTIEFYRDTTWDLCPVQQALVINKAGTIECKMTTNPDTNIRWRKDGKYISTNERMQILPNGISLKDVKATDGGKYTITATVMETGSVQSRHINVMVQVPPNIIEIPTQLNAIEGEEAIITCKANGHPSPTYSWIDPKQRDLTNIDGFYVDREKGILRIKETKKEDEGVYICWADNGAGKVSREMELIVMVKPHIQQFKNVTIEENMETFLECQATGSPPPLLTIRKQDTSAFQDNTIQRILLNRETRNGVSILTMTIKGILKSDDGLYYCMAENEAGTAQMVGHIEVEYKPDFSLSQIRKTMKTWKGKSVNISCLANANPNATITWMFQEEIIDATNPTYTIYNEPSGSKLLVRPSKSYDERDVFGKYTCEAKNRLGETTIDIMLQEAFPPGALQGINYNISSTSIKFSLKAPLNDGGSPLKSYFLEYKEEREQYKREEWAADLTTYVLENLKPRTTYKVRFAASNEVGIGPWAHEQTFLTLAESTPDIPRFLVGDGVVSDYPDQFEISWALPNDNGRKIDFFQLRYFEVFPDGKGGWLPSEKDHSEQITDYNSGPRFNIINLKSDSFYKVEIRAHNAIGYSMDGTIVFKTNKGSENTYGNNESLMAQKLVPYEMIAVVSAVLFLIVLLVIDVICFVRCRCGVVYTISSSLCRHSKESPIEDGKPKTKDSNGQLKPDLTDSGKNDVNDPASGNSEKSPMLQGDGNGSSKPIHHTITTSSKTALPKDSAV